MISLQYFDLYTAHNISHLFTEAIVSYNYSFQQYEHHVGQWTCATEHFINNMPCQLQQAELWMDEYYKNEPVSDTSLCITTVVTISLLTVRELPHRIQQNGVWIHCQGIQIFTVNLPFFGYTCLRMYSKIKFWNSPWFIIPISFLVGSPKSATLYWNIKMLIYFLPIVLLLQMVSWTLSV